MEDHERVLQGFYPNPPDYCKHKVEQAWGRRWINCPTCKYVCKEPKCPLYTQSRITRSRVLKEEKAREDQIREWYRSQRERERLREARREQSKKEVRVKRVRQRTGS